jgi:2,3-bisphosphoglycerate-independent phosphoglycerate mutase
MDLDLARQLSQENDTKIVLFVMDGLGGLPHPETGRTELETAHTTHLDMIAKESLCGFTQPVGIGITPGSGPGHLGLFGYDPMVYNIGRGVLEAVGIDFDLQPSDVAARGNFCTIDGDGLITDRRAGRISTERCAELVADLRKIDLNGAELFVEVSDTDPQKEGAKALEASSTAPEGDATAALVGKFAGEAEKYLANKSPANQLLLRGFAKRPSWPSMPDVFKMRPAAIAHYPMYRGLAKLVGMETLDVGPTIEDSLTTLRESWGSYDFFFVHYKYTDSAGEDGDFDRKVDKLEEVDAAIPGIVDMGPDVLMVAGDHSTPAVMAAHSWHSVPFMMRAPHVRADGCDMFTENSLRKGALGTIPAKEALPLAMAHAGKLAKYGA